MALKSGPFAENIPLKDSDCRSTPWTWCSGSDQCISALPVCAFDRTETQQTDRAADVHETHTHTHARTHSHALTLTHIRSHTHTHTHTHMHTQTHLHTHTFTFMHLADAFIQSDLQCIQAIHLYCQCVCSLGIEPTTFALLTQCSNHWATGTHTPHTHPHRPHTHTHTCWFLWFTGTFHRRNGFILYKLYVLLPYTYPTPKLSPLRRRCISIFPQQKLTLYDL